MTAMRRPFHSFCFWSLLFLSSAVTTPGFAQAYRSQLTFLEEIAVKYYNRGDYTEALKHFERIRQMDPANTKAAEYLALIKSQAVTKSLSNTERIDGIITDMTDLRSHLSKEETDSRDLVTLIRTLISENDNLYMALYKRAREIAELRAKIFNTPYVEEYRAIMKSLPSDRVPQDPHQSNDLLALLGENEPLDSVRPSAQSLPQPAPADLSPDSQQTKTKTTPEPQTAPQAQTSEPSETETQTPAKTTSKEKEKKQTKKTAQTSSRKPAKTAGADETEQLIAEVIADKKLPQDTTTVEKNLTEKRDLLVEKNIAVMERKENLAGIQKDLTSMNASLRQADNAYEKSLKAIEKHYRAVKNETAISHFKQQKEYADLVLEIEKKNQELAELTSAAHQNNDAIQIATKNLEALQKKYTLLSDEHDATLRSLEQLKASKEEPLTVAYEHQAALVQAAAMQEIIKDKDAALQPALESLEQQNKKLHQIDKILRYKDQQIATFKESLATAYKDIQAKNDDLAFADQSLNNAAATVTHIESLISASDSDLSTIKESVARMNTLLQESALKEADSAVNTKLIRELNSEITRLSTSLKNHTNPPLTPILSSGSETASTALLNDKLKDKDVIITDLRNEINVLKTLAANTEAESKDISRALIALHDENAALKRSGEDRLEMMKDFERRLNTIAQSANQKDLASDEHKRILAQLSTQMERLEQKAAEAQSAFTEKDMLYKSALSRVRTLENELIAINDTAERHRLEAEIISDELTAEKSALARALSENTSLLKEITKPQPSLDKPKEKTSVSSLKDEILRKDKEAEQLRELIKVFQQKADQTQELMDQKSALLNEIEKLQTAAPQTAVVQNLERDVEEKNHELDRLRNDLSTKQNELANASQETAILQEKLAALQIKQDAIVKIIEQRDAELRETQAMLTTRQQELEQAAANRDDLRKQLTEQSVNEMLNEEKLKSQNEEIAQLQNEINILRLSLTKAHEELTTHILMKDKNDAELKHLKSQLEAKTSEIKELNKTLDELRNK